MRISILILGLSLIYITSHAQLVTIYDKDGYTNVRKSASVKSTTIGKVREGQVFCISPFDDEKGDQKWRNIWFHAKPTYSQYLKSENVVTSGYMHESRITHLNDLPEIKPFHVSSNKLVFKDNSLEITFEVKPSPQSAKGIMEMKNISIKSPSGVYNFPTDALAGLINIHIEQVKVYRGRKMEIFITATGADGSDGYEVAWCIKNNKLFTMTVMQTIP